VGVAGIETDIAMTADFVPVLHHDPQLADGRLIRNLLLSELSGIPTLAEALRAIADMDWLLEIKTFPPSPEKSHPPALVVEEVLAVVAEAKIAETRTKILAFDWAVLREVEARNRKIRRVCLTEPETEAARDLWWGPGFRSATTPRAVAATGADAWSAFHETLTEQKIAEARGLGLDIFAWTVNGAADFERLAPLVDGVITDFPGRFMRRVEKEDSRFRGNDE
jgi:glycerophosphoryl diester phosphodiesterase